MEKNECISALLLTGLKDCLILNHIDSIDNPPAMTTDRIRTTISLSPDVHEAFVTMAKTQGISVSRSMGNWLADTLESAQFVTYKMAEIRRAPSESMKGLHDKVIAEMQSYPAADPVPPRLVIRGVTPAKVVAAKKAKP